MPRTTSSPLPRLLVVSSCTGAKLHKLAEQLTLDDFRQGKAHLQRRKEELREFQTTAMDLYTGAQHLLVKEGFELISTCPEVESALKIISAGYGLVDAQDVLVPYETTFNDLKSRELIKWSQDLGIHANLNEVIKDYDLVIFLLGEAYLKAAELPLQSRPNQTFIFLASGTSAKALPQHEAQQAVLALNNADARRFRYGIIGLKGFLFNQWARMIKESPEVLRDWHAEPHLAFQALEHWQAERSAPLLLRAVAAAPDPSSVAPTGIYRKDLGLNPMGLSAAEYYPTARHLLMALPRTRFTVVINNRDKLKFLKDEHGRPLEVAKRERVWHYIEGLRTLQGPRGFLTSLAYHNPDSDPLPNMPEGNIYDCGAWSYKNEPVPILRKKDGPLTSESTMRLFDEAGARAGTDIIVSPDMLIMDEDSPERAREKMDLTLAFARDMRPLARGQRLMAVTHGTLEQRHEMMARYLDLGYRHVALGSLAMKSSRNPAFVYRCVLDALEYRQQVPDLYIHVLGVSSIRWAATLTHLGVDSFDGSSMYMEAFTAGKYIQYVPDSERLIIKHRIVDNAPWSDELPECPCPACSAMRAEGWDTRAQGSSVNDKKGRPYNGGNEANMGRAVHNINMYLRALQDVQARVLAGDETLLVKREKYQKSKLGYTEPERLLI